MMHVHEYECAVCVSQCACGSQRTTSSVSFHFLPFLRQAPLFTSAFDRLAGSWASRGFSCLHLTSPHMCTRILDICAITSSFTWALRIWTQVFMHAWQPYLFDIVFTQEQRKVNRTLFTQGLWNKTPSSSHFICSLWKTVLKAYTVFFHMHACGMCLCLCLVALHTLACGEVAHLHWPEWNPDIWLIMFLSLSFLFLLFLDLAGFRWASGLCSQSYRLVWLPPAIS